MGGAAGEWLLALAQNVYFLAALALYSVLTVLWVWILTFTPLSRAYEFGRAIRAACDAAPERIALMGTGGISHWPATPNSGKINVDWDREFLRRWSANDRAALISYSDVETLRDAGQGGFEIRTLIAVAGACEGRSGETWFCEPIPIFATSGFAGVMDVSETASAKAA